MAIAVSRNRFGANNPAILFRMRTRWIIGGLVGVVLILGSTISILAMTLMHEKDSAVTKEEGDSGFNSQPTTVELLTAARRIEQGEEIDETMLAVQRVAPDQIPDGAIFSANRNEILGKFAKTLITPRLAFVTDHLSADRPLDLVNIPEGFRAIAIITDNRNCMDGLLVPGSRVDVMWTYQDALETLASFKPILSINGGNRLGEKGKCVANVPVTLMVTEAEAQDLELARNHGILSLSLHGSATTGKRTVDPKRKSTLKRLLGDDDRAQTYGTVSFTERETGRTVQGELQDDGWKLSQVGERK